MRNITPVLIFGFGIALGIIWGAAYLDRPRYYQHSVDRTNEGANGENEVEDGAPQGWQYWGDVSNRYQALFALVFGIVTAGFTYALVQVSKSQRDLLEKANRTASGALEISKEANAKSDTNIELTRDSIEQMKEANAVARQAIEASMQIERGKVVFVRASYGRGTKQATYTFRNIGRSPIEISAFGSIYGAFNATRGPNRGMAFVGFPDIVSEPMEEFTITGDKVTVFDTLVGAKTMDDFDVEIELCYKTLHRKWTYHVAVTNIGRLETVTKFPVEALEFDEDVSGKVFPPADQMVARDLQVFKGQRKLREVKPFG